MKVRTNATNGKFWFNFDPTCFLFYFIFFKLFSARTWFQRGKQIFENFKADPTLKQSMSMMIYISKPYIHYISIFYTTMNFFKFLNLLKKSKESEYFFSKANS